MQNSYAFSAAILAHLDGRQLEEADYPFYRSSRLSPDDDLRGPFMSKLEGPLGRRLIGCDGSAKRLLFSSANRPKAHSRATILALMAHDLGE
jgi:hypothetical protein